MVNEKMLEGWEYYPVKSSDGTHPSSDITSLRWAFQAVKPAGG